MISSCSSVTVRIMNSQSQLAIVATVWRRIGSPLRAFFRAEIADGAVRVPGWNDALELSRFGGLAAQSGPVSLGAWPEDIDVGDSGESGRIYAVDNRGYEAAVQVDCEAGSFRKVLEGAHVPQQGDAVSFRLRAGAGFLFDPASGVLLSHQGGVA